MTHGVGRLASVAGLACGALLALSALAGAQPQGGPCADDIKKFCKDVQRGGGRIVACLEQHQSELSEACKNARGSHPALRRAQGACQADITKFCKDVQPGGGRILKCLEAHNSELSAECKAERGKGK